LDVKLLRKQLGDKRRHTSVKTIYGDRSWISDLDIINELGGHTGCVNALRCVPASSPVMDIH
jgi:nuclear receptor interaction protein